MKSVRDFLLRAAIFGWIPGVAVGAMCGLLWGLHEQSWSAFWTAGITTAVGGALLVGGVMAVVARFGQGPAGSVDNPHHYGSTEWYRHENERRKYFEGH